MGYVIAIVLVALIVVALKFGLKRTTVFEFERGMKYDRGRFVGVLGPGQYWYCPFFVTTWKVDVRPRLVSVPGQELLSADGVSLKLSLLAKCEIVDPYSAVHKIENYQQALYMELQAALREIVGSTPIEAILNSRDELSKKALEIAGPRVRGFGLEIGSVSLKDIMFPGALKETFAQVVNARMAGLAALEKARGETAALRNLANAAKMIEANPNLMQLRLVQAFGESSGNTLMMGMPPQAAPVKAKPAARAKPKKTRRGASDQSADATEAQG
jgi:regulator of protease activity HflC (stomatin/prohibitin superfamily)